MSPTFSVCDFAAGWGSGVLGLFIGHPFDTIKVWRQTLPENKSTPSVVSTIYRLEGVKGFFKGMMFPMLTAGALNSVYFGVYGNSMRSLQDYRQVEREMCWTGKSPYYYWYLDLFISGCAGGFISLVISCPVELVKTQLQTQTSQPGIVAKRVHQYKGPWDCLIDQYYQSGIRGVYRGFVPMIWRDVYSSGIYVVSYNFVGQCFGDKHNLYVMLAGATAGFVSWSTVVPLDVIKTRIQADSKTKPKYKGMVDCAVQAYQEGGIRTFYRGFWLISLRSLPVNAVIFATYELFIKWCNGKK